MVHEYSKVGLMTFVKRALYISWTGIKASLHKSQVLSLLFWMQFKYDLTMLAWYLE